MLLKLAEKDYQQSTTIAIRNQLVSDSTLTDAEDDGKLVPEHKLFLIQNIVQGTKGLGIRWPFGQDQGRNFYHDHRAIVSALTPHPTPNYVQRNANEHLLNILITEQKTFELLNV